jgi:hypothetical protein
MYRRSAELVDKILRGTRPAKRDSGMAAGVATAAACADAAYRWGSRVLLWTIRDRPVPIAAFRPGPPRAELGRLDAV